jgi:cytochrome c oxidase subunit IV
MSNHPVEEHAQPTYHIVFVILAVFTGLEIAASFLPAPWKSIALIALAATKAVLVLLFFMHLKYDARLYAGVFTIGVILAIPVVLIVTLVLPNLH